MAPKTDAGVGPRRRLSWRNLLRGVALAAFAPYQLNRIYTRRLRPPVPAGLHADIEIRPVLDPEILRRHPDPAIRRTSSYAGPGAWGYGAWVDDALAGVCWVWSSARCGNAVVPLGHDERAIVDIYTRPGHRGRGVGPALIAYAAADAGQSGCARLIAWIWWSNKASIRAFEKAAWSYEHFAFSIVLFGCKVAGRFPGRARRR